MDATVLGKLEARSLLSGLKADQSVALDVPSQLQDTCLSAASPLAVLAKGV